MLCAFVCAKVKPNVQNPMFFSILIFFQLIQTPHNHSGFFYSFEHDGKSHRRGIPPAAE